MLEEEVAEEEAETWATWAWLIKLFLNPEQENGQMVQLEKWQLAGSLTHLLVPGGRYFH